MADVTVIIPTIRGRARLLSEAVASVAMQARPPDETRIGHDRFRAGPAAIRNRLVAEARTTWVAFLDDDDLMLRDHLAVLLDHAHDADVVYTRGELVGLPPHRAGWDPQRFPFPADRMRRVNSLPITTLVRRAAYLDAGGQPDRADAPSGYEDWGGWLRMLDAGATFVGVDVVTWVWRYQRGRR